MNKLKNLFVGAVLMAVASAACAAFQPLENHDSFRALVMDPVVVSYEGVSYQPEQIEIKAPITHMAMEMEIDGSAPAVDYDAYEQIAANEKAKEDAQLAQAFVEGMRITWVDKIVDAFDLRGRG